MATSETESSDNEVIYDLTSEARARSAMSSRPQSRSIAVQTTLEHKKPCTKSHRKRPNSEDNAKSVRIQESLKEMKRPPSNMLTIGQVCH